MSLHYRYLTGEKLKRIGIVGLSRCMMCKQAKENLDHLFLVCPVAAFCWDWLQVMLHFQSPRHFKLEDFLSSWPIANTKGYWYRIWILESSMVIRNIWKEQNQRIFKEASLSHDQLIIKI